MRPNQPRRRSTAALWIAVIVAITAVTTLAALSMTDPNANWTAFVTFPIVLATLLILLWSNYSVGRELHLLGSRFHAVSETAREYVWETDNQGRFVYITNRAEQLFGLKIEELLGQQFHEFMPEDEAFAMHHWFMGLRKTPKSFSEVEFRSVHPYSGMRWQQISGEPILDGAGKVTGYRGVGMDITDHKLVEEAQREQLELLQTLLDTIPSAIFYKDLDGKYLGCNETLMRWLGRGREHILGHTDHQLYPPDLADTYRSIDQQLLLEPGRQRYESEFGPIGGSRRNALVHTATFRDALGQVSGLVSVVTDISDQKKSERELIAAKRAAERASRAKDEFIANMSHEFRTPLTAILGFADVLLENLKESENFHAAKTIKRNGSHILDIVNDILDITKIQSGKIRTQRIPCSPMQMAADLLSSMSVQAEAKGLTLRIRQEGPLPEVILTDPKRLRQILLKLIGNAIKFTDTGQVDVVVRLLKSSTPSESDKLEFEVIDTGIGMSNEQIEKVFEPFTQADSSSTRNYGGTGLGLIISDRLAHILGGEVTVSSELGKGCCFSVTIETGPLVNVSMIEPQPVTADITETLENNAHATETPTKLDCRILLVEDGIDNQRLISFLLSKAGATVEIAPNGLECLKLALPELNHHETTLSDQDNVRQAFSQSGLPKQPLSDEDLSASATNSSEPFDIILMDMQMPIMGGAQATQRLRHANYTGPIIGLSAHSTPDSLETALEAGCDEFLSKPIDRNRLFSSIAHHLAARSFASR